MLVNICILTLALQDTCLSKFLKAGLSAIAFLFLAASPIKAEESIAKPGVFYSFNAPLSYLVYYGSKQAPIDIRTIMFIGETVIDFDTGKEISDFSPKALKRLPIIQRDPVEIKGPVYSIQGLAYTDNTCYYQCLINLPFAGVIDGEPIKLKLIEAKILLFGKPIHLEGLPPPDRRRSGYFGLQAVTAEGTVKWGKVYLVRTEGIYVDQWNNKLAKNPIEAVSPADIAILPNDKYFYFMHSSGVSDNYHGPMLQKNKNPKRFGDVTFRVHVRTGDLITQTPRIKAIELTEFQSMLNEVAKQFERISPDTKPFLVSPDYKDEELREIFNLVNSEDASSLANLIDQNITSRWFKGDRQ